MQQKGFTIKNKSAVAFFFLFFLHGTSIGNGQQGISYNVLQLYAVVCRLCAVGKLRIGAVISWLRLFKRKAQYEAINKRIKKKKRWK